MNHLSNKKLRTFIIYAVAFLPLFDLDYLLFELLDRFRIPRPSTIILFVIIPFVCFLTILKRKATRITTLAYCLTVLLYFLAHCYSVKNLMPKLFLTDNFRFSVYQELIYIIRLTLPLVMIVQFILLNPSIRELKQICCILSGLISIPILLGDLFVFGLSTYYGKTTANIFSWFTGIYEWYPPRTLASKFFFSEGNTIGILLFMLLPILYYFLTCAQTKKEKHMIAGLIFIQSLSMQILGTRVATYGAIIIPVIFTILYITDHFFVKSTPLKNHIIFFCLSETLLCSGLLNYTPAVQNQKTDSKNDVALLSNKAGQEGRDELNRLTGDIVRYSEEWRNFYVYMFETYGINARFIQSVPSMYYTEYYSYQHDPEFWTYVTLEIPVFERVNGRQVERIFYNYKFQELTAKEKLLGMGFSNFMNGSIVLEQDFLQQYYSFGAFGEILLCIPWMICIIAVVIKILQKNLKMFSLFNTCIFTSLGAGFGAAYLSGHVLDQFMTSFFLSLLIAMLLRSPRNL